MDKKIRILQINTSDDIGGAARVAWNLHRGYTRLGHSAWLAVGDKKSDDPFVVKINNTAYRNIWIRILFGARESLGPLFGKVRGAGTAYTALCNIGEYWRWRELKCGHEDFCFPATKHILEIIPKLPDIIHCHNLHGNYFDLRILPWLSKRAPTVLTLHDSWLFSGHCGYSFGCEQWRTGCYCCPDLNIYPPIHRQAVAFNWKRRKDIFDRSRFYIVTPSRWLMQRVKESILSPAVIEDKVIPNGVDLSIFKPGIRSDARGKLNIPQKAKVVLFVADNAKVNMLKDYSTAETASQAVSDRLAGQHLIFICLGSAGTPVKKRNMEIWFVGYQRDPLIVSQYYQAADVCLHSTKVDTFPNAILEAMACGIPVVATAIGGIPEQIEDNKNGFLVPLSGHETMAERVFELLTDQKLVENMSKNAAESAHSKFDVNQQIKQYLDFYADILNNNKGDL